MTEFELELIAALLPEAIGYYGLAAVADGARIAVPSSQRSIFVVPLRQALIVFLRCPMMKIAGNSPALYFSS